jgi:hypothetical protein
MNFPIDKQAHFWWGWAVAATVYPFGFWFALLCAVFVGAAKELWDKQGHGTPDIKDFYATALGGLIGAVLCVVFGAVSG